jgi:four helix bundle protein
MVKWERFEDMDAWQKARELTKAVYQITSTGAFAVDFGLRDQIHRAAVSTMSNIAEGFERGGNKEFMQFLSLAKGSVGEVRSQLYVALDSSVLTEAQFHQLKAQATNISMIIAGLIRYLKNSDFKGEKFNR